MSISAPCEGKCKQRVSMCAAAIREHRKGKMQSGGSAPQCCQSHGENTATTLTSSRASRPTLHPSGNARVAAQTASLITTSWLYFHKNVSNSRSVKGLGLFFLSADSRDIATEKLQLTELKDAAVIEGRR